MNCFECLRSKTSSPETPKPQAAPFVSTAPACPEGRPAAVGAARSAPQSPRRPAKYASFDEVLKSAKAMEVLRQYMENIQQDQLLDFLADVQRYRSETSPSSRQQQARTIFGTYVKVLADREVTLDSSVRDNISSGLEAAPSELFDQADRAVTEEIRRDVFPRFLKTPLFERLAGLAV